MSDELSRGEIVLVVEIGCYTTKIGYADTATGPAIIKTRDEWLAKESKYPIERGGLDIDYPLLGDYLKTLILSHLDKFRRPLSELAILLNLQSPLYHYRGYLESFTKTIFEGLEAAALHIASQAQTSLFACGATNGIVIDIGYATTSITPLLDSNIQYHACCSLPVGGHAAAMALARRMADNIPGLDAALCGSLAESILCTGGAINATPGDDAADTEAFVQHTVVVGAYRHACIDVLFSDASLDAAGQPSHNLAYCVHQCLRAFEPDKRQLLLDNIVLTGGMSQVKHMQKRLAAELQPVLAQSDFAADHQPKSAKFLRIPDYFPDMKGKEAHTAWFGAALITRLVFNDPKNYLSRSEYNEQGPRIVYTKPY